MNSVNLIGRIIKDTELKQTPNGTAVCSFTISVQRPNAKKGADGYYPSDMFNCTAWRQTAEFVDRYFSKGDSIGITGMITTNKYKDKDTGKERTGYEIVANNVYFVENKGKSNSGINIPFEKENAPQGNFQPVEIDETGDLPF